MAASMRGANSHNRMDDRRAARLAIEAAYAEEQDGLLADSGEEHIGLKRLGKPQTYLPQYDHRSYADEPTFVSLTDRYPSYRGRVCICGCGADMHEVGTRVCMSDYCDCDSFEELEEPDYGRHSLELGGVSDLEDWELMPRRRRFDPTADLGELYEQARREDGDRPDVPTFLARYERGAYG